MLTGILLAVVGLWMMGYFFLSFSVCAPNTTTINLDLLSQRQNGILVGIGLSIVGVALTLLVKIFSTDFKKILQSEARIYSVTLGTLGKKYVDMLVLEDDMQSADDGKLIKVRILKSEPSEWYLENKKGWMFASSVRESKVTATPVSLVQPVVEVSRPVAPTKSVIEATSVATVQTQLSSPAVTLNIQSSTASVKQRTVPTDKVYNHYLAEVKKHRQALKEAAQREETAKAEVESVRKEVADLNNKLEAARVQNLKLENNLAIADHTIEGHKDTISDLTLSLGNKRQADRAAPEEIHSTATSEASSGSADPNWTNIDDFHPKQYKTDVTRRLMHMSRRHLAGPGSADLKVSIRFTIQADGRPTNIQIIRTSDDTEECAKRCINFILAAGPFRPLGSQKLAHLDVDAELVDERDVNTTQISALQIAALGNKF
ncbi:MAG: hypothetical protein HYX67_04080 [Candidatus Melainabacteria bacterium]|nr:hypothetical protein [Candidatus Melainabacteria bacterium]